MKRNLSFLLGGALIFGSSCYNLNTDNKNSKDHNVIETADHSNLERIINATYNLRRDSVYSETLVDRNNNILGVTYNKTTIFGSAFAFGRDKNKTYFATAEHCLADEPEEKEQELFNGLIKIKFALYQTNIKLVNFTKIGEETIAELKEVTRDNNSDCAILEGKDLNPDLFKIYSNFAEPNALKLGQFIYSVGFPHGSGFSWGKHITHGIISSFDVDQLPFKSKGTIFTEAALDPGMSGGPSCIVENEIPYIAGINIRLYPALHSKFGISLGLLDLIKKSKLEHLVNKNKQGTLIQNK